MEMLGRPRVTKLAPIGGGDSTLLAWSEMGEGPPLVLFHGLCDSHRTWRRVAPRLAKHFRVYMPDLPGHGLSGRPDAPYTLEWYARTMAAWLDEVGLERAHVLGHSFGGGVAQWMLLEHRARFDRLVLVAPGGLGPEVGPALRLATFPILGPLLAPSVIRLATPLALRYSDDFARPDAEEIERIAWMNSAPGTGMAFRRTVSGCIDLFGQYMQTWQRIHEVDPLPPIALMWGERDRIIPIHHGDHATKVIEGATLERYACGHFPHLECSDRFADDVARFLDDRVPATRTRMRWLPVPRRPVSRVRRFFLRLGSALRTALRSASAAAA